MTEFLSLGYEGEDIEVIALDSLLRTNFIELIYCNDERDIRDISSTGVAAILVAREYENLVLKDTKALTIQSPHLCFASSNRISARLLFSNAKEKVQNIAKSAKIILNVYIGNNINIGENVVIMAGAYIKDNINIGEESITHPNAVIYNDNKIGKKRHLLANCVIGGDGFSYAHNENGEHYGIYHNGNVILEGFAEAGTCIATDRAVFDDAIIKAGTRADNLVQTGHNYGTGQNCIIVAQAGVSGSSELGRNVVMNGQSAASGRLRIGNFSTVTARGGVSKNLEGGRAYGGFPVMLRKD